LSVQRRRVGSQATGAGNTTFTLDGSITWSTTPNDTYTFALGAPQFELDTRWINFGQPFWKKRYQHAYLELKAPETSTTLYLDTLRDRTDAISQSATITLGASGAVWDTSTWDGSESDWGGTAAQSQRIRLALTGRQLRFRLRNVQPDQPLTLLRFGVTAELLSDRS
jgi:hypothetical protein